MWLPVILRRWAWRSIIARSFSSIDTVILTFGTLPSVWLA